RLVPFTVTFADDQQDRQLSAKLRAELPGILSWCVRGCLDWQRHGLGLPESVRTATAAYRDSQDTIADFFAQCCVTGGTDFRCRAGDLYGRYKSWCDATGEGALSQKSFGELLTERGLQRLTSNGVWYVGIALAATE